MDTVKDTPKAKHIKGLDSIRFILAAIVIFSHGFGLHIQNHFSKDEMLSSSIGKVVWLLCSNLYNGQAAVIVFFVISGFCIHYPYAVGKPLNTIAFLTGRYIRIGLPLSIVLFLAYIAFDVKPLAYAGVWSLICELIYYSMYPILFRMRGYFNSWIPLYGISLAIVICVLIFVDTPPVSHSGVLMDFAVYGPTLTWLIGLPIWLLGCHLADIVSKLNHTDIRAYKIWLYRLLIFTSMVALSITKFHGEKLFGFDTPNSITFLGFSVIAYFWLLQEIKWYFKNSPFKLLEYGGKFSYSLYISHPIIYYLAPLCVEKFGFFLFPISSTNQVLLSTLIIFILGYLYFVLVEQPGHKLARRISAKLI